ncbi:MAG TPA: Ppx/GppA family phosphatase [Myxococcaceae bacterium]|nr:Ppx/GppA family phosphatase [Myxococcaceae bacterium]
MERFASFDVGTNTVLMAVAERGADGGLVALLERADITRLGEGVAATGLLTSPAIDRTAVAISRFADEARAAGVQTFAAVATSAAREAANGSQLVAAVRERAGVEVEILSGEDEARLTFRAVQEDFGQGAVQLVAVDIGGGSTELVFGPARGAPSFRRSVDVGSVRLTEQFVTRHPIPELERRMIREHVRRAFSDLPTPALGARAVAVAATATSLSAISSVRAGDVDRRYDHGWAPLSRSELETLAEMLCGMSLEERRRLGGLDPRRADVICAGAYILLEALHRLEIDECLVSDRGVRWGLLWERFGAPLRTDRC